MCVYVCLYVYIYVCVRLCLLNVDLGCVLCDCTRMERAKGATYLYNQWSILWVCIKLFLAVVRVLNEYFTIHHRRVAHTGAVFAT